MIRQPIPINSQLSSNEGSSSPFVLRCIKNIELNRTLPVLDIPCGHGRHSFLLSERGYEVVGADIDSRCLTSMREHVFRVAEKRISLLRVDARSKLPFPSHAFGLALIVHYVERSIISSVEPLIAPGGYLIYETFGFNGNNWQQLPQAGEVKSLVASNFDILVYREKLAHRHSGHPVSVKLFAKKGHPK
jgi:SAM-dependent methyltransferase